MKVAQDAAPDPSPEDLTATLKDLFYQEEIAATRGDLRTRKAMAAHAVEVAARLHVIAARRAMEAHQAAYAHISARTTTSFKNTRARIF